ncbi:MAG: putative glycogen debranching enzyme, partial [Planctomycetota bacterium]
EGLLPNIFDATPELSQYGSADAALWFARAVQLHQRATHHTGLVCSRFRVPLTEIAEAYLAGTSLGIAVDGAGLLLAGDENQNVTWMDARTGGIPVTPRHGRPVELNALWYQLQMYLSELADLDMDRTVAKLWRARAERTGQAFMEQFWNAKLGYLADTVQDSPSGADYSIRPNAVLAASFEYSPLSRAERGDIVQRALDELLTPRGLRTLSPYDPRYIGRYAGGPEERDAAYHQGSAWPWLLGPLTEATLRAFPANGPRVRKLAEAVRGIANHLPEHGMGQVSELFDGDAPHRPGGTPAQAWSVAEVLRALTMLQERGA